MARKTVQGGGEAEFFAAIEALTWREMKSVSELLALQLEGKVDAPALAEALGDAAESFASGED